MAYVYGPLASDMNAIHSLNHLFHDDISHTLAPSKLSDLNRDYEAEYDIDPHFISPSKQ